MVGEEFLEERGRFCCWRGHDFLFFLVLGGEYDCGEGPNLGRRKCSCRIRSTGRGGVEVEEVGWGRRGRNSGSSYDEIVIVEVTIENLFECLKGCKIRKLC